jgi:hypothetical protein
VAGMTSAVRGEATGLLNGFLVWALGTVLILLLSALGLGQIFGALELAPIGEGSNEVKSSKPRYLRK